MATRPTGAQIAQIGIEGSPGAGGVASFKARAYTASLAADPKINSHRVGGEKFDAAQTLVSELTTLKLTDGLPCYQAMTHLAAGVIGNETVTAIAGTDAIEHKFTARNGAVDNRVTFVIEQGDDTRAVRAANANITKLTMKWNWNKGEASMSGEGFADTLEVGVAMSEDAESPELHDILPGHLELFMGTNPAALSKVTQALSFEFSVSDRASAVRYLGMPLDTVEGSPQWEIKVTENVSDSTDAYFDNLRAGDTLYLRLVATGRQLGPGVYEKFVQDYAVQVAGIEEVGDEDDVWAQTALFKPTTDAAGRNLEWTLINTVEPVTPGVTVPDDE